MISNEGIKSIAHNCGADLCGVASVDRFSAAPAGFHPRDIFPSAESVVAFAVRLPDAAFASPGPVPYTFLTTQVLNRVSTMTFDLTGELERMGMTVVPVPSEPYEFWDANTMTGKGIMSLRHAAALAGMGTILRNHLLTNDRFGNRLTLGAVLTDAVIAPDPLSDTPQCPDSCTVCRIQCPAGAIDDDGINQKLCRPHAEGLNERGFFLYRCRTCREKCPLSKGKRPKKGKEINS